MSTLDQGPSRGLDELVIPLAALLVVLALTGCAQGTTGQAGTPYAPYPPETTGIRPEHGGGGWRWRRYVGGEAPRDSGSLYLRAS